MDAILHINCLFDAQIKVIKEDEVLFSYDTLESLADDVDLKAENISNFKLEVFPILKKRESGFIAYSAYFKIVNNNIFCESKQVEIYKLPENHYIIKLNPLKIFVEDFEEYDKVEISDNKIKTLKLIESITKKGEVKIFEINGDKPKLLEKYYVEIKKDAQKTNNEILKFVEFFENLKFAGGQKAKENLSRNLCEKLNDETLKSFFGNFDEFKPINYYYDIAVVLFYKKEKIARVFGANFENLLIDNIYEIE